MTYANGYETSQTSLNTIRKARKTANIIGAVLLVATAFFMTSTARADEPMTGMRVIFAYSSSDTAETIYANLETVARDACVNNMHVSFMRRQTVRGCVRDVMNAAVGVIPREDVAELHRMKRA